jgi:hypothetical protein
MNIFLSKIPLWFRNEEINKADIFISYSHHRDGIKYAAALHNRLRINEKDPSTFYDIYIDTKSGISSRTQPEIVNEIASRSGMMVIVGNEQSFESEFIKGEIKSFFKYNKEKPLKVIYPHSLSDKLKTAKWFEDIYESTNSLFETEDNFFLEVTPSDYVIETIFDSFTFPTQQQLVIKSEEKVKNRGTIALVFTIIAILAAVLAGVAGISAVNSANKATQSQADANNANLEKTTALSQANSAKIELGKANDHLRNTNLQLTNTEQQLDEVKPQLKKAKVDLVKAESETREAQQQTFIARKETEDALKDRNIALSEKEQAVKDKDTALAERSKAIDERTFAQNEAKKQQDISKSFLLVNEAVETFNYNKLLVPETLRSLFSATEMSLTRDNYSALFDSPLRNMSSFLPHHTSKEFKIDHINKISSDGKCYVLYDKEEIKVFSAEDNSLLNKATLTRFNKYDINDGNILISNYNAEQKSCLAFVVADSRDGIAHILDVQKNKSVQLELEQGGDEFLINTFNISPKGTYICLKEEIRGLPGANDVNVLYVYNTLTRKYFEIGTPENTYNANIFAGVFDENEEKIITLSTSINKPSTTNVEYHNIQTEETKVHPSPENQSIPISGGGLISYHDGLIAIYNEGVISIWSMNKGVEPELSAVLKSELTPYAVRLFNGKLNIFGLSNSQKYYQETWSIQGKNCLQNKEPAIIDPEDKGEFIWRFDNCKLKQIVSVKGYIGAIKFDDKSEFITAYIEKGKYFEDSAAPVKSQSSDGIYTASATKNLVTVNKGISNIMRLPVEEGIIDKISFSLDNRWIAFTVNTIQEDYVDFDGTPEYGNGAIFLYALPEVLLKDVREKLAFQTK